MQIEELFLRHQSVATSGFSKDAYKPGLDAMKRLDEVLGKPSEKLRCIHVAGTNGKGSVSSMLAAALAAKGLRVALYTSPHLVDFRERMKIVSGDSFSMIPRESVQEFLDTYERYTEGMTFFEVTTGMAFWWFSTQKVDVAVIEVGLGGRLDCTNIITPELSVITSIGLDHCALLGETRAAIASEKAGIFKPGVPAVVWGHDPETDSVFEVKASASGCELHFAGSFPLPGEEELNSLDLKSPSQKMNLRTVLCALGILGVEADMDAIARTAAVTGLHGRWEEVTTTTPEGVEAVLILDIGHNPAALKANFEGLEGPSIIVYGVMADKDYSTNISILPENSFIVLCAPRTPRALPVDELKDAFSRIRPALPATVADGVADALRKALAIADREGVFRILIIGSTFVVSEAYEYLKLYD
ncbi:MAG: bifunctional folylpolyglutamate synthase/dihydrofolate synthase [Bacteroidales bacterium]|nr:bifunctional folylpolyglutamate synthase/dihydrofolate synthase [Bacteroidales bacterium]